MDMDLTVLERKRLMLQRLHRHDFLGRFDAHSVFNRQLLMDDHHSLNGTTQAAETEQGGAYSAVSNGNCSSARKVAVTKQRRRCNSSLSSSNRKRKAGIEFDTEENEEEESAAQAEDAGEENSEITVKAEGEASTNTSCKERFKVSEVQKPDYIHVRARRGQATDSHSLAERARREKISKKMKYLQDLVPGCNKVTGKAGMLDEIINYVQSLQKQVEFLSMKLVAVNRRLDFSTDNIFVKEAPAYVGCLPSPAAQFGTTNSSSYHYNLMQQQQQGSSSSILETAAVDQSQKSGQRSLPIPEAFLESSSYMPIPGSGWELDWQSLLNSGFH